ncbi:uncharacterized protein I206_103173 [Kwoniella pini CBS 10737]|uniref:NmrA-like domain-containing protein n=1 Tax=Kwoniella pini CBS 10737 TaxID=1296096 RepID=A0A1B9IAU2_9TREE|nr:uncharacterized protein I206_01822 [Kwoniella pini CBS 10737]OCF52531.1 hypothetical protein I206_01822 [Kwoniella pini CBS 10737]
MSGVSEGVRVLNDHIDSANSNDKQKIIIFGATGDQGKSVCKYLIEDGNWDVVGISRNPNSDSSKELKDIGVQVVKGDMGDPSSYAQALQGAYGAFVNADFWGPYFESGQNPTIASETESKYSRDAINECNKAELKHVIYSTLDELHDADVPHFQSKANVTKYIKATCLPTTYLYTSYYFSNATKFGQISKDKNDRLLLSIPAPDECLIPGYAVEQTGKWVLKALQNPNEFIGKDIQACSDIISVAQMASTLSDVAETKFDTLELSKEEFYSEDYKKKTDKEIWVNMEMFYRKLIRRDVAASKKLVPDQWDFKQWAENSKEFRKVAGI